MSGTVILLVVIVVTYLIGKYAIEEGQKINKVGMLLKMVLWHLLQIKVKPD